MPAKQTFTALMLLALVSATGRGGDKEPRHVERTPYPHFPIVQSMARSGNSASVARWARPGLESHATGGYVGGGSVKHNGALSRSSGGYGPVKDGTFGWDFVGFRGRVGRVFLGTAPKHREPAYTAGYRPDGPQVKDVFALRPIRKAVLESKAENPVHKPGHR